MEVRIRNLDTETHHQAKIIAVREKKSLNELLLKIIREGVWDIKTDNKKKKMK